MASHPAKKSPRFLPGGKSMISTSSLAVMMHPEKKSAIKNSTVIVEHLIKPVRFIEQFNFGLRVPAQFCANLV